MTEIAFRPCQPSDVDAAVPLIYSSGPAAFDYVFCDRSAEQSLAFLRQTFVRGKSEFGYQQHTAVLQANRVVGIGAVRTADQNWGFTLAAATEIMRFYGVAGGLRTIRRGLKIEQVIQPPKGKVGILYHLAVAPDS